MKVYISVDIEGVACVAAPEEVDMAQGAQYEPFRHQMPAEAMAACRGAWAAGARCVVVKDAHWTGRNLDPHAMQAQEGKERLEQIKIIGNVIQEYAKAAFANPLNSQNPEVILQRIQLELDKMYGNTGNATGQPANGESPIPAGGEQLAVQGDEGGGLPVPQPA